ncbi:MAG: TlpA disulfide reductase family protein [Candidatus Acidiferrales bacterium]
MSLKNTVRGIFCGKRLSTLPAGEPAPAFSLNDTSGQNVTLEQALKKGPVVAAFFKVSCPTCQFTFPFLERMYETYGNSSFTLLGISQNDAADTREFSQEFGVKFPLLLDDETTFTASNEYGITNVPSIFLISQEGKILERSVGFSKRDLENMAREAARATSKPPAPLFKPGEVIPDHKPG